MNTSSKRRARRQVTLAIALALCAAGNLATAGPFKVLHHFDGVNGARPTGGMVLDSDGVLHGTTKYRRRPPDDGRHPTGTLFHIRTDGTHYQVDHVFDDDGRNPLGELAIDASDTIYGTLEIGRDNGAIFTDHPVDGYRLLAYIGTGVGRRPQGGVTRGPDGVLYGTTSDEGGHPCACGTVFKWDPVTGDFTVVHKFDEDGRPSATLVLIGNTLYGTTFWGGPFGVNVDGSGFTVFTPDQGLQFGDGLTPDASGNLWGVASTDGQAPYTGGIYRVTPAGTYEWRVRFKVGQGSNPVGALLLGKDGRLYGNTARGGTKGKGTIFRYDPDTNLIDKLHDFDGPRGSTPYTGLVQDASGAIYGETHEGGKFGYGVVYKLVP